MNNSSTNACPETLRRLIDGDPESEKIAQPQGTLTTAVRGSHIHITVCLRRWWSLLMSFSPTDAQLHDAELMFRRAAKIADFWLKVAVIVAMLCIGTEIAMAFLPGGAVDRAIGGGR